MVRGMLQILFALYVFVVVCGSETDVSPIVIIGNLYVGSKDYLMSPILYPESCIHSSVGDNACLQYSHGLYWISCNSQNRCDKPLSLFRCRGMRPPNTEKTITVVQDRGCMFLGNHCAYIYDQKEGICVHALQHKNKLVPSMLCPTQVCWNTCGSYASFWNGTHIKCTCGTTCDV